MIKLALLLVFAVCLFIYGFFPVSNNIVDINTDLPERLDNHVFNIQELYRPHVDKTVLIVIDALRWDFITPELMPLTTSLMKSDGCVSKIQVESPTVTLPRIKALTTGNIPQYIDVVRNLASSEVLADSWLHSAYKKNQKIVFYGDNTWEKLFPNIFTRSEGTTSFFVWDFTEVDHNVTRNVDKELERDDWNILILHYLGLDHIGHVLGPFSSKIAPKLREMDEIIYRIYRKVSEKSPVVSFITGDHGMRDSGGHGGTTQPEIVVPLISLGIKCQNSSFYQTDIPANFATLLGLNIPATSIGNLQESLLLDLPKDQYLYACFYNTNLLLKKVAVTPQSCQDAGHYYRDFLKTNSVYSAEESSRLFGECSKILTKSLYENSSKQSMVLLSLALGIMLNLLLVFIYKLVATVKCKFESVVSNNLGVFSLLVVLLHPLSFISTSFIEEEHYFWIYFTVTLFIILATCATKNTRDLIHIFCVLTLIRFSTDLNSTLENSVQNTDNWFNFMNRPENHFYHLLFFIAGLIGVFGILQCYFRSGACFRALTLVLIYMLKIFPNYSAVLGKIIWFLILFQRTVCKESSISCWVLVGALLMKTHNALLVSIGVYTGLTVLNLTQNIGTPVKAILIYMVSNCFYFLQGHRNSLASVDISVGYIGLSDYYPLVVTAQVLMQVYTFHILFHLFMLRHFTNNTERKNFWLSLLTIRTSVIFFTSLVTLIFRHHLFIWSVFAPKLFIESIHTAVLFIEITVWYCITYIRLKLYKTVNK